MNEWNDRSISGLTLSQLMELPAFRNSRVVAGANGLNRTVTSINQLDAPDVKNWAHPDELIITTGFVFKDNLLELDSLIPRMVQLSLAGLCIKPKRFIKAIPPSTIQMADELNFPLIELAEDSHFDVILKDFFSALMDRQTAFLQQILGLNELLMRMMLDGVKLNRIAEKLSVLVQNSISIIDALNDRKEFSLYPANLENVKLEDLEANETPENCFSLPLRIDNKQVGALCIWATYQSIRDSDIAVLNKLLLPVTLEISQEYSLREIENSNFNDFLIHLFNDRITDEAHEIRRAQSVRINPLEQHMLVCLRMPEQVNIANFNGYLRTASVFNDIIVMLENRGFSCRIAKDGTVCHLIIHTSPKSTRGSLNGVKKTLAEILRNVRKTYPQFITAAGCGRAYTGIKGIIRSHQEALNALYMCETTFPEMEFVFYGDLGLIRLIFSQTPAGEVRDFIDENLGELLKLTPRKRDEFLETLDHYFECHGNLKRMSEEMYTHYNTIVYRIRRIQEITGRNLAAEEDRFCLETAVRLYRFTEARFGLQG